MKHEHRYLIGVLAAVVLAIALALIAPGGEGAIAQGDTIYVDADATSGAKDGSSWADAYTDLQGALAVAATDDEIWVAAGTYKPTSGTDRAISFQMVNGVAIYGGFDPTVGDDTWAERDWVANPTVLSGDLGDDDEPGFVNNAENSYHIFYHPAGTDLNSTAILDGFTITGGNANGGDYAHRFGAGMHNDGSSPALANCTFLANSAQDSGGGMWNTNSSSPALTGCTFSGNSAGYGGGMVNYSASSPTLTGCTFSGNSALQDGGGMWNYDASSPTLTGCTFSGNSAGEEGGGIHNQLSAPTLTDCTFSDNAAGYGGGIYNEGASSLTGCTFSGNTATQGAGMYNAHSSPTLASCTFTGNTATSQGGGLYNSGGSTPALTNCTFSNNSADWGGGGMGNYGSSPTLTGCTFEGNTSGKGGGGMWNYNLASPTLTGCTFEGNSAGSWGGGMFNQKSSSPTLTDVTFEGNTAGSYGGGMYNFDYSAPALTNCTFSGNSAVSHGGGMYNDVYSSPTLANCTFAGNSATYGGGLSNGGYCLPRLTNCTLVGNSATYGGGFYGIGNGVTLINCIVWGNSPTQILSVAGLPTVTYSDVQGGHTGTGNIDRYPFFVDTGDGALRLGACSPCIDVGDNAAPDLPALDFEGDARIVDGNGDGTATVDMGVDEAVDVGTCFHVYLPVVLRAY